MSYTEATVQLLSPQGTLVENDVTAEYLPWIEKLDDSRLQDFYRQMVVIRRFDIEAGNLQRQGQLALWIPSLGQEAAQVGSGYAAKPQDHIFPAYREHVVGRIRGLDPMKVIASVLASALKFQMPVPATPVSIRNAAAVTSSAAYARPVLSAKPATPAIGPARKSTRSRQCDARSRNSPAPACAGSNRQFAAASPVASRSVT